jgi:hypothetical protein
MNKELDKLLCKLDGQITYFRMINQENSLLIDKLIELQKDIHILYDMNKRNKGKIKKVLNE